MAYLTNEERKERFVKRIEYFTFFGCLDLSDGVSILCDEDKYKLILENKPTIFAQEVSRFTTWWVINYFHKLNGFQGMDTIKFEILNK